MKDDIMFNQNWEYDLKIGKRGENHFSRLLREGAEYYTVEVKTDQQIDRTGNLFIEVSSRGKQSGINRTKADYWYIQIKDYDFGFMIKTELLQKVLKAHESDIVSGGDNNTSRAYKISLTQMMRSILHYA